MAIKRFLFVLFVLALTFLLITGCGPKVENSGSKALPDGIFEGASDATDKGYVAATVKIEGGKIVDVEMKEFRGDGSLKTPETYTYEPWHEAVEKLPQAVIAVQSAEIDAVTGATSTTEKFKQAVRRALGEEKQPEKRYADGRFEGISDPSRTGYVAVEMVVQQGTITQVIMQEFRGDLSLKTKETYDYEPWHKAFDELPAAVIKSQSADIDVVTGATSTSNKFKQAVRRALGEEQPYKNGDYKDGVYQGESDKNDKGHVEVKVQVLLGRIVDVAIVEYRGDGTEKTKETYDYEPWHKAVDELPKAVVTKQSAAVDVVTGASGTTEKFVQAVERALEQAK